MEEGGREDGDDLEEGEEMEKGRKGRKGRWVNTKRKSIRNVNMKWKR